MTARPMYGNGKPARRPVPDYGQLRAYLAAMLRQRGTLTVAEAAEVAGVGEGQARTALEALVHAGEADRVGKRTYHAGGAS